MRCSAAVLLAFLSACQGPNPPSPIDRLQAQAEEQRRRYGDFNLPRKIGTVENAGLQLPAVSPDGNSLLYLRTDAETLSPMTLLGSADPAHTPPDRSLAIWIRPAAGTAPGRPLSRGRWAHSPVWSDSGAAVAYTADGDEHGSRILHVRMTDGHTTPLGVAGAINCLPRFDGDDRTLLFCSTAHPAAPLRVFRQAIDDGEPTAVSPEGADCFLPIASDKDRHALCARANGDSVDWVVCSPAGCTAIACGCGSSQRPAIVQTWAGIVSPLAPDRNALLFYDTLESRVGVCHIAERIVRRHRTGSIAACWLDNRTLALATTDEIFIVNTTTGVSTSLFSGTWIPCRYASASRRLILLGKDRPTRFSIWEVVFKGT